jgi:tetratricopeptide (TPR) repeat protein
MFRSYTILWKATGTRQGAVWSRCFTAILLLAAVGLAPFPAAARPQLSREGRIGRYYLATGRWRDAAAAFDRAVKRGHPSPAELEGLGYASLKAGLYPEGAAAYSALCEKFPKEASFWVDLGLANAYQEPARLDEAEKAFRRALAVDPHDPHACLDLAVLLHRFGRPRRRCRSTKRRLPCRPGRVTL